MRLAMSTFLLLSPLLAAGCLLNPQQKPAAQVPAATAGADMFPQPTAGISIAAGPGEDMKLEKLLDEFSKVTGVALLATPETKTVLAKSTTGLNRGIDIPASEVYSVVETVLIRNDLALVPLHDREPRIASVVALTQGGSQVLRASALFVPARDIAAFARHPAVLVTTFLDLPHVDVRTISNSMRTMFTDANTQQIIPVGNSNALIVTGFGGTVAGLVRLLQEVDENAKREMAEQSESKVQSSAPAKDEKPK
jgi:hypothetical protein